MSPVVAAARSVASTAHPVWHFALVAGFAVATYLVIAVRDRRDRREEPAAPRAQVTTIHRSWLYALAAASVGAATVHGFVCPEHFREATLFGVFFAVIAVLQLGWAVLVIARPSLRLLRLGALANAAVVALWLMSRTTGLPVGPEVWEPEAITAADAVATTLELLLVAGASWALFRGELRGRHSARPADASELAQLVQATSAQTAR